MEREVLIALFRLSRDTRHISARTLADEVLGTPTQIGEALVQLERLGVVDATRARLTMKGLVLATQLGAGSGGPRLHHRKAEPKAAPAAQPEAQPEPVPSEERVPVAALPSEPPRAPAAGRSPWNAPLEARIGLHS